MSEYLEHHGIKGQRWGIRRYQFKDGSLTPLGRKHLAGIDTKGLERIKRFGDLVNYKVLGNQTVDSLLKSNTSLYRIQSNDTFENRAFYATYKKSDVEKYMGLFGQNLKNRARAESKQNGESEGSSDDMKIYQLKLKNTKDLKVPSDENCAYILDGVIKKDATFRNNLSASIDNAIANMRRPSQQLLLRNASRIIKSDKEPSNEDKKALYRALNLTLTHHNDFDIYVQNKFYSELSKKGYSALLDYNDKSYSSYHAKRPMIVFDVNSIRLSSIDAVKDESVASLYNKYNRERLAREFIEQTIGNASKSSYYALVNGMRFVDEYKRR